MLKKILKVIGVVIALFVVVGVFLPSTYKVQRSQQIKATPQLVFDQVNNLKASEAWSPWGEDDPTMSITYSGPAEGVGAKGSWTSENSGVGSQVITLSEAPRLIEISLDFGREGTGVASYEFTPVADGVTVTWSMRGDAGFNLVGRYFGLAMDGMLGPYFEKGLAKLKQVSEHKSVEAAAAAQVILQAMAQARTPLNVGGFDTPESVLHDAIADVYLVSNIHGSPFDKDDNGYISRIADDGRVLNHKWINGENPDVTLNAPKGMAISGDTLYVADIDHVRMFDRETGAPKGAVAVKGATFLNDVAASADGTIYVSDSGMKAGFAPSGTDAVYAIVNGKVAVVIKNKDLGRPNGLLAVDGGLWVVTFGSGELYFIALDGKRSQVQKLLTGSLDGIVQLSDGTLAISSWEGSSVLRGTPGQDFTVLASDVASPADIGYDSKRNRVLIPHFEGNTIQIRPL